MTLMTENESFINKIDSISTDLSLKTLKINNFSVSLTYSPPKLDLNKLFTQGTALSFSDFEKDREAALKIAHYLLLSKQSTKHSILGQTLLKRLGNRASSDLAEKKGLVANQEVKGTFSQLRQSSIDISAIHYLNGEELYLNRFQSSLVTSIANNQQVAVSAPTSAGKSFIIERWISEKFSSEITQDIALVVPTRALIHQMEMDMRNIISKSGLSDIEIVTIPSNAFSDSQKRKLFFFTQERFHAYLSHEESGLNLSSIVIDEAQKISDGSRGILLQKVIEEATRRNPSAQLIFLTPASKNPEILLSNDLDSKKVIKSGEVTVGQNLYWITQLPRTPKNWQIELKRNMKSFVLGSFSLENSPKSVLERLSYIASHIGGNDSGNIVYVNRAADAEKCASQLSKFLLNKNFQPSEELVELSNFAAESIHPDYRLVETLKGGVAFHYGNMPLLLRSEIERLFSLGEIKFLVCTSTLVEGVNTSCRNLFVRGPQRGQGIKMDSIDFWNLAGRAGRWGKEFEGNIFCIDTNKPDIWINGTPPSKKETYHIKRAIDSALEDQDEIEAGLLSEKPNDWKSRKSEFESSINYLYDRYLSNNFSFDESFSVNREWLDEIGALIKDSLNEITVFPETIKSNPGINPKYMQSLLDYFYNRGKPPEDYIPPHPHSDDAAERLALVFARTFSHLGSDIGPSKRSFGLAILVNNWMRGYPLSRIIKSLIVHYREKDPKKKLPNIIRDTLNDVENIARFQAPKYLSCYNAILTQYLIEIQRTDLLDEIQDFSLFLEFGASSVTQISAMSLGLTRSSSIALAEYLIGDNLTKDEILSNLRSINIESLDLPRVIKNELMDIIG